MTNKVKKLGTDNASQLDEFHYHEMIDRLSLFAEVIGEQLENHPAVQAERKIKKNIEHVIELLYSSYQLASNIRNKKFPS